ncbi:chemotaxis protein CheY [Kiloniella spongiae]|uniref:Chemotaxis protein CheY n=1 Tax=Kiloniella spongiae TaxID=1489064 RepID=A0A0H2MN72_9PROT|nr:response regulator [Kiloniella spongiae]KLN62232.1 chemotaxis protein CheY [Kiloniella spongiae]
MNDICTHLLVVDDDTRLRELLQKFLTDQGFMVTAASSAEEARSKLASLSFDLLILDIMMPGESGLDLTKSLREKDDVPILLLTAMGETSDRISGLEVGADDYLSKPFEPRELVLRINAILKRMQTTAPITEFSTENVVFGSFRFDVRKSQLWNNDEFIHLTDVEAALLKTLAQQAGTAVGRDDLIEDGSELSNTRSVDVQVTRLRRKIEQDPKYPRFLQTIRGVGYILKTD